jgi:hypothetical protein
VEAINLEAKAAKMKVAIEEFGPCPYYKGHFSFSPFAVGVILGIWVSIVGAAIIMKLTGHW